MDDEPHLPPKFAEALQQAHRERIYVPPQRDEIILRAAKEAFHASQRNRWRKQWIAGMAAAAVLFLAALIGVWMASNPTQRFAGEDINGDGVVDILDALALTQNLQHGQPRKPTWDVNKDGKIDDADPQTIARRITTLDPEG